MPHVKEEPGTPTMNGGNHLQDLQPPPYSPPSPKAMDLGPPVDHCNPSSPQPLTPVYHQHSGSSSPSFQGGQVYRPPGVVAAGSPANLEHEFQRFKLDCPAYQDSGGGLVIKNPSTPISGPTSPHTPSALPDIYIQDYSQDWAGSHHGTHGGDSDKGLDADFVNTLREGLEPIDDQLLAALTGTGGTFVDPAVEEQFKMNY